MKKIVVVLVALVFAAPSMADVNITVSHVQDTNVVTIGFTSNEANRVRAFGLNVTLSNDANIVEVIPAFVGECTESGKGYGIFPGRIVIAADGTVTDYGSIAAEYSDLPSDTLEGPPDSNGVTLECASLYAPVGADFNAPPQTGDLATLIIDKDCTLCISANVSRAGATGVVMENPAEVVTVNYPVCIEVNVPDGEIECYKGQPDYAEWDAVGKPDCWCYTRQCRGDADNQMGGSSKTGYYAVGPLDLNILISGWLVLEPGFGPGINSIPNGICADFAHDQGGSSKTGYYRVGPTDLNILIAHWLVLEPGFGPGVPADCLEP